MREARSVFLVAMGSYLAMTALIVGLALRRTGGVLVYSLDDPYIHMAVARMLALHGNYGIGPDVYESASTSPAWTVMLAALFRVTSERAFNWLPLLLNLAAGVWGLWVFATRQAAFQFISPSLRWVAAALLPLALYLPGLTVTGMEHTLHATMTLLIIILLDRVAEGDASATPAFYAFLALSSLLRPEAMFVALGCGAALLLTVGVGAAMRSVFACAAPIVALGVFNRLHGQYFFPNSVVAKTLLEEGGVGPWVPHVGQFVDAARDDVMLTVLFLVVLAYWIVLARRRRGCHAAPCIAFIVSTTLHINYAALGWLDRYQAYLIILGSFIVLQGMADAATDRRRVVMAAALAVLLLLLPWGKFRLMLRAPVTITNIYRAQYQLARFLAEYYPQRAVAVNDLGLVALLHGAPLIDLYGLGSHDVLRTWKEGRFDAAYVRDLAQQRGIPVTVVYEEWFGHLIPTEWRRVAVWTLDERDTPQPWRVVFYAPSAETAGELDQNLRAFVPTLPGGVAVQYRLDRSNGKQP